MLEPVDYSQHYNSGGSPGKKIKTAVSQLRALATQTRNLGRLGQGAWELGQGAWELGQGAWELGLPQIRKCFFFLVTLACFDISSKKRCLYRLFIYHFKAHTISNKLV